MDRDEAKALVAEVEPLGTIDCMLMNKHLTINPDYGLSLPVLPTTMVVGGLILLLMIEGIVLGCYVYKKRKSLGPTGETVKRVTDKPVSGFRLLLSRTRKKPKAPSMPVSTTSSPEDLLEPEDPATGIHPIRMMKILREVFPDGQTTKKYAKQLDTKDKTVQATTLVSTESLPDMEAPISVEIEEARF